VAGHRPAVPKPMKLQLVEQTSGKCANPGCANVLLELHHIREWRVYHVHDADHMIAICASCHDSVDRGKSRQPPRPWPTRAVSASAPASRSGRCRCPFGRCGSCELGADRDTGWMESSRGLRPAPDASRSGPDGAPNNLAASCCSGRPGVVRQRLPSRRLPVVARGVRSGCGT
jgi:hypothetical protein